MDDLAQQAIYAALSGNWKEAVKINSKILKDNPYDIDALNRKARALAQLGKITTAKRICKKVLRMDPYNSIAAKSIEKWEITTPKNSISYRQLQSFLEEPGKTKIVSLIHLGCYETIAELECGEEVKIFSHTHRVTIVTQNGKYVGRFPDDLAARLRMLIKIGNSYLTLVKSANTKEVKVFIKEVLRVKELETTPSFPV